MHLLAFLSLLFFRARLRQCRAVALPPPFPPWPSASSALLPFEGELHLHLYLTEALCFMDAFACMQQRREIHNAGGAIAALKHAATCA